MGTASPSHRARFLLGVALSAALGALLLRSFVGQAKDAASSASFDRRAVVAQRALTALVERAGAQGDAVRRAAAAWQAKTPEVAQARVLLTSGLKLEASTAGGDTGANAAPRRLKREEKPFYDRAQRIATAVRTNREEATSRKAENELATLPDGRLSVAGPLESGGQIIGAVEIETVAPPKAAGEPWWPALLTIAGAWAAFALLGLAIGERRALLGLAAGACVAGGLFAYASASKGAIDRERERGAAAVSELAKRHLALANELVGTLGLPASPPLAAQAWDVDDYRRPRGLLSADGSVDAARLKADSAEADSRMGRSMLAAGLLSLALLAFVGFGGLAALGQTLHRNRQAYYYIAPAILGMLVLVFFPFFYGITLSFTDSNIYNTSQPLADIWIGLRNYATILGDFQLVKRGDAGSVVNYLNFYWTFGFTIAWTVTNVALGVTSGLILALILNTKGLALRPMYRVLLILPWAMPNYITALIWKGMFHRQFGVINHMIGVFGGDPLNWFDHPFSSYVTALTTNGWLSFPFMMVVSLGALQSIPADLYEAARVDGASRWQQFTAITLPSLRPALVPAVIISVVWTFNMFNIIYLVTAGEPSGATEILVTQAYKFAFERYRYGYAAAYSTVIFIILLVYGVIQNRVSKATEA